VLYPAFDIYCHSSLDLASEMFPIAILQALAGGLPVVASAVGGIPEMIQQGVSGRLVPPDDAEALAAAICLLADDRNLRESMGRAAHHLHHTRFHAAVMAQRIEQVYTSALSDAHLRPGDLS
jgi:glycosyltransferase involved in cell wall biosynthesis